MKFKSFLKSKKYILFDRNKTTINGEKYMSNDINIEFCYSKRKNFGDTLTPIIFDYIKNKFNLNRARIPSRGKHILMCGSIIGFGNFDAVVWGSGLLNEGYYKRISEKKYIKYDIRALRGPLTRELLSKRYKSIPKIYGDPAILLPLIYNNEYQDKKYEISIVNHYADGFQKHHGFHNIDIFCGDAKRIIQEICESKIIISSALHGIIVAEAYGVPAVWLKSPNLDEFKYLDWFLSTNRKESDIYSISSLEEFDRMKVLFPPTNKIKKMQHDLLNTFPKELWKQ